MPGLLPLLTLLNAQQPQVYKQKLFTLLISVKLPELLTWQPGLIYKQTIKVKPQHKLLPSLHAGKVLPHQLLKKIKLPQLRRIAHALLNGTPGKLPKTPSGPQNAKLATLMLILLPKVEVLPSESSSDVLSESAASLVLLTTSAFTKRRPKLLMVCTTMISTRLSSTEKPHERLFSEHTKVLKDMI
jgi:DNA-directed RNA polymerase subunit H (RpoH/RPB5)